MTSVRCTAGLLLCACLALLTNPLAADDFTGVWATFYKSGVMHKGRDEGPWRYGLYGDTRYYDRLGGINQYVLQPGFGYRLNGRLSVWGGYTWFRSEVDGALKIDEQRTWQQLSWTMVHWQYATLKSRTRLEQRHRDGWRDTDLRLRQQFRLDARFKFNPDLIFILGDEYFRHVRNTSWTRQGYGQNRFYTGLGFDFHNVHIEALYMNQQYPMRQAPDLVNHLLVMAIKM